MESIKIDVNSWHYKLIKSINGYVDAYDICEYRSKLIKAVFAGVLISFLLIFLVVGVSFSLITFILGIFTIFTLGFDHLVPEQIGSFIVLFFICAIGLHAYRKQKSRQHYRERKLGTIKKMYLSWKEKHCAPVKFVEADQNE